jgi:hypothetical protein
MSSSPVTARQGARHSPPAPLDRLRRWPLWGALALHGSDVQQMTTQLREGVVKKSPR